jgi:hypothetical protein
MVVLAVLAAQTAVAVRITKPVTVALTAVAAVTMVRVRAMVR